VTAIHKHKINFRTDFSGNFKLCGLSLLFGWKNYEVFTVYGKSYLVENILVV